MIKQIILSIISGIFGAILTILCQRKFIAYDLKRDVLIQFVENRYDINGEQFTKAINKIRDIYAKEEEVVAAVDEFHRLILSKSSSRDKANQKLYQIYLKMCSSIKIKPMEETKFLMPFNVKDDNN